MVIVGNITFNYSLKNIPNANKSQYEKLMVESMESLINRMRWKLFWLKSPATNPNRKETFGFRSAAKAPSDPDLKRFEEDLIKMVTNIEMKKANNMLQEKMNEDIRLIKKKKEIIIKADKTDNHYLVPVEDYKKLLIENITKDYRKDTIETVNKINREAAKIAKDLDLDDRIEAIALKEAFLTIKDHKEDWPARVSCRLINPTMSNIGKISKSILDKVNNTLRNMLGINQWRSTGEVINWFNSIEDKNRLKFLKFDVEKFYPSITKPLLSKAINFAKLYINITEQEEEIIYHSRKNVLVDNKGQIWVKKGNKDFDVSMGSADGAEISELVGVYLISTMMGDFDKDMFGIYRDDGLMVVKGGGPETDRARKKLIQIFQNEGLQITTECNVTLVNFLDVVLDLKNGTSRPYTKPNGSTKYVCTTSSHPPSVIKSIPAGVAKRLSTISTNKEMFEQEISHYQEAMKYSGYKEKLEFVVKDNPINEFNNKNKRKSRDAIWFNPPWSNNVRTNIAGKFISLVKKHFPRNSPLYCIFNSKKIKVSYKTTKNINSIISAHNKKVMSNKRENRAKKGCNCRGGVPSCPLEGNCLDGEMVYKAVAKTPSGSRLYYGQTARTFKERHYGHVSDFRHRSQKKSTTLSNFIWNCRDNGIEPEIEWSKVKSAKPYSLGSKRCDLCLSEKLEIAKDKTGRMLNRRREILNKCLHKENCKLSSIFIPTVSLTTDKSTITEETESEISTEEESLATTDEEEDIIEDRNNENPTLELSEREETFSNTASTENPEEVVEQLDEGGDEGQIDQQPQEQDGEVDPPQPRRSRRTKNQYWQCLQYSSIIERKPG